MKKYFTLFFILNVCVLYGSINVFAAETFPTSTKINARILPTVWYSTLSADDGDVIKIYAGIQNNSDINFTGTATFYVDNKEISENSFSSTADSLKDVSANWKANPGSHDVQVKIRTSLSSDKTLVSYESDKSNISITKKVTQEVVQEAVLSAVNYIVTKTDDLTGVLADKIENFEKPITSDNSSISIKNLKSAVLGASTGPASNSQDKSNNINVDSVFNMAVGVLAFLVKNWKWTLLGLVVLFFIYKIIGWKRG